MDETNKKLAFAIVDFFQSIITKDSHSISKDEKESLEVAIQCIQDVFKINVEDDKQKHLFSSDDANLRSIFEVYLQAKKSKKPTSPAGTAEVSKSQKKEAEEFKLKGNQLVTQQKYAEAIDMYSQAISLDPFNPVFLSNRAAAQSQLQRHDLAVEDAKLALDLDPTFSKAYSRMGHAYYQLGQYQASVEAYTKGLELDPNNNTMQQALAQAQKKIPAPSQPDPSAMLNQPGFLQMAQQMLQNNPGLASMAQQFLGGSPGGTAGGEGGSDGSDMNDMVNRPEFQQMAQQAMSDPNFMQNIKNLFGGAGGPSTGPSRGSNKRHS